MQDGAVMQDWTNYGKPGAYKSLRWREWDRSKNGIPGAFEILPKPGRNPELPSKWPIFQIGVLPSASLPGGSNVVKSGNGYKVPTSWGAAKPLRCVLKYRSVLSPSPLHPQAQTETTPPTLPG